MAEEQVVTQDELNSLLSSLEMGTEQVFSRVRRRRKLAVVHEARVHDFARTEALSRMMLRGLETVYSQFAATVSSRLSAYFRARWHIALLSLDQLTYEQFKRAVPDPTVIGLLNLTPLPGKAILELNLSIGFWIVDRMLGGGGELPKAVRPLTSIESALVENALSKMVSELSIPWPGVSPVQAELTQVLHSPGGAEIAAPGQAVIVASFEVNADDLTGMASICIPVDSLKPISQEQSSDSPSAGTSTGASPRECLTHIPVPCAVRLGTLRISAAELRTLKAGDVLCLDRSASSPIEFLVGHLPRFRCRPLTLGRKLVVEIVG